MQSHRMATDLQKSTRRSWSPEGTTAFLDAFSKRQAEFQHTRKKKFAMHNILEDLLAQGVLNEPTIVEMLNIKLKNLLRAFEATADNKKRTGESASKAPFEQKMEEIFGCKPEIRNRHTLNMLGKSIDALPMSITNVENIEPRTSSSAN